jgi:isopenicillin N synthase-like dioxygenase
MTLLHVPIVDLTPYRKGTPEGKAAVAEQVGQACRDIGFLVVSGHGISEDLIRETYDVSKEFFDLPFGEKVKADRPAPDQVRGYSAVGGEGLSYSLDEPTPPDLKESLSIGPVNVPAGDSYFTCEAAGPHFADNVWPARPADLKPIWIDYFQAVDSLATDLMRLFALALKLDENYFRQDHRQEHLDDARSALSQADHAATSRATACGCSLGLRQHDHPSQGTFRWWLAGKE